MTGRDTLVRISQQSCAFNAITSCIIILQESMVDTDYVLDIIDLLQERANEVEADVERMVSECSEGAVQ